jgi:N6-L-threonylcarbamoyladenine synthase
MLIFAIETSCDETALALVEASGTKAHPRFRVVQNSVTTQIPIHRPFGGVVPNLAKREHLKNLPLMYEGLFKTGTKEKNLWKKIDAIAVTVGPGLEPALWTGINFAEEKGMLWQKPVWGANHIEGHLYSFLLAKKKEEKLFPAIGAIVSGGHTTLVHLKNLHTREILGETRDDAAGEAFDKVARLMDLPYPGGPEIEKLANTLPPGWVDPITFPRPMIHEPGYETSFSGLKTAVRYFLHDNPHASKADVARAFSEAATDVLAAKVKRAAEAYKAKSILLSGGVAANEMLRTKLKKTADTLKKKFVVAEREFNTDNATMIAVAAYIAHQEKRVLPLEAHGDLGIE